MGVRRSGVESVIPWATALLILWGFKVHYYGLKEKKKKKASFYFLMPKCFQPYYLILSAAATAVKSLQSCPTLCDPINSSPPGFPIPGILQARTLEWVAISFSNARKWKVKVKSLSRVWNMSTPGSNIPSCFLLKAFSFLKGLDLWSIHYELIFV